jgi:hypothetical protein
LGHEPTWAAINNFRVLPDGERSFSQRFSKKDHYRMILYIWYSKARATQYTPVLKPASHVNLATPHVGVAFSFSGC